MELMRHFSMRFDLHCFQQPGDVLRRQEPGAPKRMYGLCCCKKGAARSTSRSSYDPSLKPDSDAPLLLLRKVFALPTCLSLRFTTFGLKGGFPMVLPLAVPMHALIKPGPLSCPMKHILPQAASNWRRN